MTGIKSKIYLFELIQTRIAPTKVQKQFNVEEKCLKKSTHLSKSIVNLFIICPKGVTS